MIWTSDEAAAATGGTLTRSFGVSGISIDSRSVTKGDLFIALQAARDGHDFVADAISAGAAGAMVSRRPEGVDEDAPLLIVDDTMRALERLGAAGRRRTNAKVVAVTGSVGKTSTKEMLRLALATYGSVHVSEKSFNNQWGVPLTLARMPRETEFAVIEIGMNHPGEIAPLSKLAEPHIALITTVALAHAAAFEGIEAIAEEKSSIFSGLVQGGIAVFHSDMEPAALGAVERAASALAESSLRFGDAEEALYKLASLVIADGVAKASARTPSGPISFSLQTTAPHFVTNALGALGVVEALGANAGLAAAALGQWLPPTGRGTRHRVEAANGTFMLIDDAYNANPTSMTAALAVLAAEATGPQGVRVAVLGDMLELGARESAIHAGLADHAALRDVGRVICVGPRMRALYDNLPDGKCAIWVEAPEQIDVADVAGQGDVVLVKGSNGSGVARVADALKALAKG